MLGCSGGAEGPQEASLTFLDLGEVHETVRERSWPEITQQEKGGLSQASFLRARWVGLKVWKGRGPGMEGVLNIPPPIMRSTTRKRGPERDTGYRDTHAET